MNAANEAKPLQGNSASSLRTGADAARASHTPGVWFVESEESSRFGAPQRDGTRALMDLYVSHATSGGRIAQVFSNCLVNTDDGLRCNARVIAAASELLAEVERQYTELADFRADWPGRSTMEGQAKLIRLRDLIAKATGRDARDVQDDYGTRLAALAKAGAAA